MNRAIVFDLDGTLITCENRQKYVLFSILNCHGYTHVDFINEWWKYKRNGYNTESALIRIGIPQASLIAFEWKKVIENFSWVMFDTAFEDSIPTIDFLKYNGYYKVYILTARKFKLQLFQTIQRLGFTDTVEDVIVVAPEKVVEEKSSILLKIKPKLYIGDTELDYKAASNSGTDFIALSRGQRSYQFLKNSGIKQIENNLKFLKQID